jgi:NADH dehydrogenase
MRGKRGKLFIAGATGFLGRHLLKVLKEKDFEFVCCIRGNDPFKIKMVEEMGGTPLRDCDILDRKSLERGIKDADSVIHLVGIIREKGGYSFHSIHVEGTQNLVQISEEMGVKKFIYISALGADVKSEIPYLRTKAQAEDIVRNSHLCHLILRPSIILGKGADILNLILKFWILHIYPIPGGGNYFLSPVWVGNVVDVILKGIEEDISGTYELCGPDVISFYEFLSTIRGFKGKRVLFLPVPLNWVMKPLSFLEKLSIPLPITSDQLKMLSMGSVCKSKSPWKDLGIKPLPFREALKKSL